MKVIIAGGGTGGHIFPALAIGHAVMRHYPDAEVLFVGANGKMEMEKVPLEGFRIIGLDIAGFNRNNLFKNILLPFKLLKSGMRARSILKSFQPDIVIGVGGYASFPMLNAAQSIGIPTLIQEQNSHAGKSNMMLGKKAQKVCVAFDGMEHFFDKNKIVYTGNPVRTLIANSAKTRTEGKAAFGLDVQKKTILIVGGSLGALSINKAIAAGWESLAGEYQLLWQTGKPFFETAKTTINSEDVKMFDFIRNMDDAYAAADVIISRAGAMAISELCIVGKPVIFVPYPFASEDHQTVNAVSLVNKNAAMIIKNDEVDIALVKTVKDLIQNESLCAEMGHNIAQLAIKDADEKIMNEIKILTKS